MRLKDLLRADWSAKPQKLATSARVNREVSRRFLTASMRRSISQRCGGRPKVRRKAWEKWLTDKLHSAATEAKETSPYNFAVRNSFARRACQGARCPRVRLGEAGIPP